MQNQMSTNLPAPGNAASLIRCSLIALVILFYSHVAASAGQIPAQTSTRSDDTCEIQVQDVTIVRPVPIFSIREAHALTFAGSPTLVVLWTENQQQYYAVSLDGKSVNIVRASETVIPLRFASFDPRLGEPAMAPQLKSANEAGVFLVQFLTQPLEEYRSALNDIGAVIHHYIGNSTFIVSGSGAARAAAAAMPFVRWLGDYHPAYRLEEYIRTNVLDDPSQNAPQHYNIMMLEPGTLMKAKVANRIPALGGTIEANVPNGFLIKASLTPSQLIQVAAMDEVLYIDRWQPPRTYMNNVRSVGGADYVETVAGYNGQGVRAEVMDSNVRNTHQAFAAIPVLFHGSHSGDSSHGTCTYGIVFGSGAANALGRGMLPGAQGIFADFDFLTDRYNHVAQLSQSPYFAVFESNSWGYGQTTDYGTFAADMDLNLFDHDVVLLQAQANNGNTSSDVSAFAKNIVSVGGIRHFDTASLADDSWTNSGSIGPTLDGRIKPDLSFWYDSILTTSNTNDTSYIASFGGTSAATPMTAGHFGIFFQMWSNGVFGNPVTPGGTVFDNRPHMSTSKAMMINTCSPYPFSGVTADLTRVHQGWGRPDVKRLFDLRYKFFIVNETDLISNLQTRSYQLAIASGEPELRATLVYTDPPGVPASSQNRINDLSLRVTAPDGTTYWGNNGMTSGNVTPPGGSANTRDTVENVWLSSPAAGTWTVEVIGAEIVQDSHVETPATDADYALVVSGIVPVPVFGDMNCNGRLDGDDVSAFVLGVLRPTSYALSYPTCSLLNGDFNHDAQLTLSDVSGFVAALLAP
jgi:serine protease AprX